MVMLLVLAGIVLDFEEQLYALYNCFSSFAVWSGISQHPNDEVLQVSDSASSTQCLPQCHLQGPR
jgi:hypothetical protein